MLIAVRIFIKPVIPALLKDFFGVIKLRRKRHVPFLLGIVPYFCENVNLRRPLSEKKYFFAARLCPLSITATRYSRAPPLIPAVSVRTLIAIDYAIPPTHTYRNRFRHTADAHLSQSLLPHRRCALIVIAFSTLPTRTYRPTYAAPTPFSGHVRYFLNHSVSLKRISLLEQLTVTSPPSEETTILPFIASKPPSAVSE